MIEQGKLFTKHNSRYVVFFESLPWLDIEIYVSKIAISFYHNIAILCVKMSSVTRALTVNEKMLG